MECLRVTPEHFGGEPEWRRMACMRHALREPVVGDAVVLSPGSVVSALLQELQFVNTFPPPRSVSCV